MEEGAGKSWRDLSIALNTSLGQPHWVGCMETLWPQRRLCGPFTQPQFPSPGQRWEPSCDSFLRVAGPAWSAICWLLVGLCSFSWYYFTEPKAKPPIFSSLTSSPWPTPLHSCLDTRRAGEPRQHPLSCSIDERSNPKCLQTIGNTQVPRAYLLRWRVSQSPDSGQRNPSFFPLWPLFIFWTWLRDPRTMESILYNFICKSSILKVSLMPLQYCI